MIEMNGKAFCNGCHACSSACPHKCISMVSDDEGFLYPEVDSTRCSECHLCEKVCPILNPKNVLNADLPSAYAVKNNDDNTREKSSSGGVFAALAEYVIDEGGIVFGAAFDSRFDVVHIGVEKKEDLVKLRGSKYVQSTIGDTYREAKKALDAGRTVLFTGTPCQIGGLRAFLRKDYEKLYTQDIICHGVPSPKVWRRYLDYQQTRKNSKIKEISFRNKKKSWKKYAVSFAFENGAEISEPFMENPYMRAFLRNLSLRNSCYQCRFKGISRDSDITLADFWGIENILPEMDDDKGTSLVIVQNEKGRRLLNSVSDSLSLRTVDPEVAIKENASAVISSNLPRQRKYFFNKLQKQPFDKLVNKCTHPSFYTRAKNKLKRIIKRCLKWERQRSK